MIVSSMSLSFAGNPNFVNTIPLYTYVSLHIQHLIYVQQYEFFVFTMKQIASIFRNISFAGQYTFFG